MKRLYMTIYRYHEDLGEDERRTLVKKFLELGAGPGPIAQYERLDGSGGFILAEAPDDLVEKDFENTLRYLPWITSEVIPVTTMEDAFPVIQRVYG